MSETHIKQRIDLDALEAALAKATPGEARLLPNGGANMVEDPTYFGVLGGRGFYDGPELGGFDLTGYIGEADAQRLVLSYNALPALIAELRQLRARTTPEPIGDKHRDGNWWLCWEPGYQAWYKVRWQHERWHMSGGSLFGTPTHALPMPPAPEAV
jgi:hypothetical protein